LLFFISTATADRSLIWLDAAQLIVLVVVNKLARGCIDTDSRQPFGYFACCGHDTRYDDPPFVRLRLFDLLPTRTIKMPSSTSDR